MLQRFLLNGKGGRSPVDEFANGIGHDNHLKEADAPAVTGFATFRATLAVKEILVGDFQRIDIEHFNQFLTGLISRSASRANFPNEALCENCLQGGGNKEGLQPHIDETGYRTGGIIRV